jgi:Ni/Fe-hydrogenase subunit HybB-like protein
MEANMPKIVHSKELPVGLRDISTFAESAQIIDGWNSTFAQNRFTKLAQYVAIGFTLLGVFGVYNTVQNGQGGWGLNQNIFWGLSIANFVFWIGVAHAGTLVSTAFLLANIEWRGRVSRIAETITICAIPVAMFFPVIHLGKPWLWPMLLPLPDAHGLTPNYTSPILWDFWALLGYFVFSLIMWLCSMLPDVTRKYGSGQLQLGWFFTESQWQILHLGQKAMAFILLPLVFLVHTLVSFIFAMTLVPEWNDPLLPTYFIAGALQSGFAVLIVVVCLLTILNTKGKSNPKDKASYFIVTPTTIQYLVQFLPVLSWAVGYFYIREFFIHGANISIAYGVIWAVLLIVNVCIPQLLFWERFQHTKAILFIAAANVFGLWLERIFIVYRGFKSPIGSAWYISWNEVFLTFGGIGVFILLMLFVLKKIPLLTASEWEEDWNEEIVS